MTDPYGLAYGLFLTIFSLLFILECFPSVKRSVNLLGDAVMKNVTDKFEKQRCPGGLEQPPEEATDENVSKEGSKKYICCGEARHAGMEKFLTTSPHYCGIGDIMYPNGEVDICGTTLHLAPGMAEDFWYYVYNNDPLISCFASDRNNINSTFVRKFFWLYDHSFAFLFFALFENSGPDAAAGQFFLGLFMSGISTFNRLMYTCPCLLGTKLDCIRHCCRANLYLSFFYLFGVAMTFIFLGVLILVSGSNQEAAAGKVAKFYALVVLVDLFTRTILLILTFNSTGGMELKLGPIVVFSRGQWFVEKYKSGCIPVDEVEVISKQGCCFEIVTYISKKMLARVNEAKSIAEEKIREARAVSETKIREMKAMSIGNKSDVEKGDGFITVHVEAKGDGEAKIETPA